MNSAVEKVAEWLHGELSSVPHNINTVYVEWDHSYLEPNTPREIVLISMDTFGFEEIKKGSFDCSNRDDLLRLGDFIWEGRHGLSLRQADYPRADWTDVLKNAAATAEVRTLARSRDLLLLIGHHDDAVCDVS